MLPVRGPAAGEGLIGAYYSIAGWPMMLASSERGAFLKKVHALKVSRGPALPNNAFLHHTTAGPVRFGWTPCERLSSP